MAECNQGEHTKGRKQHSKVKIHPRRYIQHNYHDHSTETDENKSGELTDEKKQVIEHRIARLFPSKLHKLLLMADNGGFAHIISWQIHGRAFKIHRVKEFIAEVIPLHFCHGNITSFYRQLNLYGFLKITQGPDKGAYYHELFLRGKCFLTKKIERHKVKGTFVKGIKNPAHEPNFYDMPFVKVTSGYAVASASLQRDTDKSLLEENVSATDMASYLQQTKVKAFRLEDIDSDISSIMSDPFDNTVSNDFFCNDEEFFQFLQELKLPMDPVEKKTDPEGVFDDISLEDDLTNSRQYFTLGEYVDMCALLQMIIDNLE
jgi:hypothetical protein